MALSGYCVWSGGGLARETTDLIIPDTLLFWKTEKFVPEQRDGLSTAIGS
jgi:hypothetical protein